MYNKIYNKRHIHSVKSFPFIIARGGFQSGYRKFGYRNSCNIFLGIRFHSIYIFI